MKTIEYKCPSGMILPIEVTYNQYDGFQAFLGATDVTDCFVHAMGKAYIAGLIAELRPKILDKRQIDRSHEQLERKAGG